MGEGGGEVNLYPFRGDTMSVGEVKVEVGALLLLLVCRGGMLVMMCTILY